MATTSNGFGTDMGFVATFRSALSERVLAGAALVAVAFAFLCEGQPVAPMAQVYTLATLALVGICWHIYHENAGLGIGIFIAVLYAVILLTPGWSHSDGTLALFIVPCTLATVLLSPVVGICLSCFSGAVLIWGYGVVAASAMAPRLITLSVLLAGELVILAALANARHMQYLASSSYRAMRDEVNAAREQRLVLKQTQEDLTRVNVELAGLVDRQATLRQAADEARLAKETFVAHVSHELRTPLNMIIGFTELIVKTPSVYGATLPARLLSDLDVVYRNSMHLLGLINDVLDLTRMQRTRRSLDLDECSIADVIAEAVQITAPLFEARQLYHRVTVQEGLSALICDRGRIRQVLLNLLSNAARFTDRGGITIEARQQSDDSVLVSVADTGSGIAQKDLERVFEPYQHEDSGGRHGEGTGLGLTISKEIVELHGGKMWVESQLGSGSVFYFDLPIDPRPADLAGSARWINPYQSYEPRTRPSLAQAPQPRRRYVILEQEDMLRDLLTHYMDPDEIISCSTSDQALEQIEHAATQALVLNDTRIDGPVRSCLPFDLPNETPVVGTWIPGRSFLARQLHATDYLVKPVSASALFEALAKVDAEVQTILIVDDEVEALQLFSRILASGEQRYRVLQASNGMHALSLMRRQKPDVILLDMQMPVMNGYQLLAAMQQDEQLHDIPAIIVSASDPMDWPVNCDVLFVTRKGGLTGEEYVACLNALTQILNPEHSEPYRGRSETWPDR